MQLVGKRPPVSCLRYVCSARLVSWTWRAREELCGICCPPRKRRRKTQLRVRSTVGPSTVVLHPTCCASWWTHRLVDRTAVVVNCKAAVYEGREVKTIASDHPIHTHDVRREPVEGFGSPSSWPAEPTLLSASRADALRPGFPANARPLWNARSTHKYTAVL